jgi:hypothetical protein
LTKCPRCGGQMIVEYGESSCLCCGYLPGGSLIPGQSIGPAPERQGSLASLKGLFTKPKQEEKMVTATKAVAEYSESIPKLVIPTLAPVPPKPARHGKGGGNIAIGHYYTAHLAELKDEAKQYGDAATRERWGLSNSQFSRLKERWTCAPPRDKVSKSVPAEGTPQSVVNPAVKAKPVVEAKPVHTDAQLCTPVNTGAQKSPETKEPDVLAALAIVFGEIAGEFTKVNKKLDGLDTAVDALIPPDGVYLTDTTKEEIVYCIIKTYSGGAEIAAKKIVQLFGVLN